MNNCLNINNIDCFLYSLNEIIFEKCFVDIIHSVVVADIALRWYTKIIIFKKRPFTFHNALNDAMYTALLTAWVGPNTLSLLTLPKEVRRLADSPEFPPQPRRRVGPYPSLMAALNGRSSRRLACPLCGEPIWVRHWYTAAPDRYYADFRCRAHGSFLCRLTLSPMEGGQWQGRLAVPEVTPEIGRAHV